MLPSIDDLTQQLEALVGREESESMSTTTNESGQSLSNGLDSITKRLEELATPRSEEKTSQNSHYHGKNGNNHNDTVKTESKHIESHNREEEHDSNTNSTTSGNVSNPNNLQKDSEEYKQCMKNLEVFKGTYFTHMRNKEGSELTNKECKIVLSFILNQFYIYPKLHPDDKRVKLLDDTKKLLHIILHFFQDKKTTEKFRKENFILLQSSHNGRTGKLEILLRDALSDIGNNLFIGTQFGRQFIQECKINQDDIELPKLKLKSYSLLPEHYQDFDENMNFPLGKGTNIKSLHNLTQSVN